MHSPNALRVLLLSEAITSIRKNNAKYINYVGNLTHLTTKNEMLQLAQSFSNYFIMVETDIDRSIKAIADKDLLILASINQEKQLHQPLLGTLNHCNTYPDYPFSNETPKKLLRFYLITKKLLLKFTEKTSIQKCRHQKKLKTHTYKIE